jgi:hypothetical protein
MRIQPLPVRSRLTLLHNEAKDQHRYPSGLGTGHLSGNCWPEIYLRAWPDFQRKKDQ